MNLAMSKGSDYDRGYFDRLSEAKRLERAFVKFPINSPHVRSVKGPCIVSAMRCVKKLAFRQIFRDEGGYYIDKRLQRKQGEIVSRSPNIDKALEEFTCNLNLIIDAALQHKLRLIFLTHPSLWHSNLSEKERDLLWFGWIGTSGRFYAPEVLEASINAYNECLRRVCLERHVLCIDLGSLVPKTTAMLYDDVHLNDSGNEYVARILEETVLAECNVEEFSCPRSM